MTIDITPKKRVIRKIIRNPKKQQSPIEPPKQKKRVVKKIIRKKKPDQIPDNNTILTESNKTCNIPETSNKPGESNESEESNEPEESNKPFLEQKENNDPNDEDDLEEVLVVNWLCVPHKKTYLLDKITQEVYDKISHDLIGIRYKSDDELSLVDFF